MTHISISVRKVRGLGARYIFACPEEREKQDIERLPSEIDILRDPLYSKQTRIAGVVSYNATSGLPDTERCQCLCLRCALLACKSMVMHRGVLSNHLGMAMQSSFVQLPIPSHSVLQIVLRSCGSGEQCAMGPCVLGYIT